MFHEELNPSFYVNFEKQLFHCHGCHFGGDVFAFIQRFKGTDHAGAMSFLAEWAGLNGARKEKRVISAVYTYRDEDGALSYQSVRYTPKAFRFRRPNGRGGWIWNLDGVRVVLYRLPELLAADPSQPVFIVEGEKDADRLAALGLVITTNPGGAGKWRREFNAYLRNRLVVIVRDNDQAGRDHGEQVARSLRESTPLHLIEKPSPGTGASLLADVLSLVATGRSVSTLTEARNEDEWRKRITAKLLTGPDVVLIDNVRRRLESAALSAALTAPVWEDRVLGVSLMARVPVRCAWIATGNNPALSAEMSRRTVRIRLDAKRDRPWLREGFRHPDLRAWTREHRSDLVWASLTLGQAWISAGRPLENVTFGMFDSWARVLAAFSALPRFAASSTT